MSDLTPPLVSIVDYGMGNLFSVKHACEHLGLKALVTSDKEAILDSDGLILPGVGAFGDAIANLNKLDLINPISDFIQSGRPFMGICLGMQLLMSESEEFGRHKGLDIIPGKVSRFSVENEAGDKVPHVGWNKVNWPVSTKDFIWENSPLAGIGNGEFMYFVHSYYCKPQDNKLVLSVTNYASIDYCSSIFWENIFACQFHPERSSLQGLEVYKNWAYSFRRAKN